MPSVQYKVNVLRTAFKRTMNHDERKTIVIHTNKVHNTAVKIDELRLNDAWSRACERQE